jgi:glycosyltransferase involved in cell wall biosynthesis
MNPVFPTIDYWAIRLLRIMGCRVVFTAHNPLPHEEKPSSLRKYSRMYRAADRIIALTNFTQNEIASRCGVSARKISVISHGDFSYVFSRYPCNNELAESVRRAARQRRVISFLGHIRPYKGLKYFAQAFRLIKQQVPDSFFLVAGSLLIGNQKELTEMLSQSCEADDLWCDIRFIPTPDMKAYLSVTDVLVQPYVTASQSGNTVMAYAQSIPVISTDVGGLGEMTDDGETGFVIPSRDPRALADAVEKCLEEDTYARMSENARQIAAEKYSWDSIATQTLAVYSLLGVLSRRA